MREIVQKLLADMRQRLAPGVSSAAVPSLRERDSWGRRHIQAVLPLLAWIGYMVAALSIWGDNLLPWLPDWLQYVLFFWPGWILAALLMYFGQQALQQALDMRAYRAVLLRSEHYTLAEYCRYLKRKLRQAKHDRSLGAAAELARLSGLQLKLNELLQSGAAAQDWQLTQGDLGQEADQAEAVLQFYEELGVDPLQELDARLPGELRQRIEALDREADSRPPTARSSVDSL